MRRNFKRWVLLLVPVLVGGWLATASSSPANAQPEPMQVSTVCVNWLSGLIRAVDADEDCTRGEFASNLTENFPYTLCVNPLSKLLRLDPSCAYYEQTLTIPDDLPVDVCVNSLIGLLRYAAPGTSCPRGWLPGSLAVPPPVATDDVYTTDEDTPLTGNVITDDTGNGPDSDPSGFPLSVSEVNGDAGAIGTTITLPSGATLAMQSTGAFTYDPNGMFESLAVSESAEETFEYTLFNGFTSDTATVTITITGVNDAPTDIALSNTSVDENQAAGALVGTFSTTDPDTSDTHTYSLVAGTGDTGNASFQIVGNQLQTAVPLDFETQSSYSIRVQTDDGNGGTFEEVFTITVNDLNDPPTGIQLDDTTVPENEPVGTLVGAFTTTDQDAGDSHTYTLATGTGDDDNASFQIVDDQLFTNAVFDFEAKSSYSIRVRSTDEGGLFVEEQFTITVEDVDEPPVAVDDTNTITEEAPNDAEADDNTVTGSVLENDTDPEGATLSVTDGGTIAGDYGELVLSSNGSYTYTLDDANSEVNALTTGQSLEDSFGYTASDGALTDTATLTITINGANDPPVAVDDTNAITEEAPNDSDPDNNTVSGDVLANDTDPEGDDLTVDDPGTVTGQYGELLLNADGSYTYTLDDTNSTVNALGSGETLTDSFSYDVTDGGLTDTGALDITINGANDPPTAVDDTNTITEEAPNDTEPDNNSVSGDVLANDSDPEGDMLSVTDGGTIAGQYGELALNSNGTYTYTLDDANSAVDGLAAGESLIDSFSYTASDGSGTDTATLDITINGANDPPDAVDDANSVTEEAPNDEDPDDNTATGNVLDNDTDPEGATLSVSEVEDDSGNVGVEVAGQYGTLLLSSDGSYTYTLDDDNPDVNALIDNETLTDSFTYTASDGSLTDTAALDITINGADDPVTAVDDTNSVTEEAPNDTDPNNNSATGDVLTNDVDPEGGTLAVTQVEGSGANVGATLAGDFGSLVLNSNGSYTYTLDDANPDVDSLTTGESLVDSFTYAASDGGTTDDATLTITVNGANDPPVTVDDANTITEEAPNDSDTTNNMVSADVLTNDTDPEGATLSVSEVEGDSNNVGVSVAGDYGTLVLNGDGSYTYTLDDDNAEVNGLLDGESLTDDFSYTASDGAATATGTLMITIEGANDPPTALDDTNSITEEAPNDADAANNTATGDVLANDIDPEGETLTVTEVEGDTGNVGMSVAGDYGELVLSSNGSYTYTLDDADPEVNSLTTGESLEETFGYTMSDGGISDAATLTITINGANDPPTVESADFLDENGENGIGNTFFGYGVSAPAGVPSVVIPGSLTFTDPEGGAVTVVSTTPVTPDTNELILVNDDGTFRYIPATGFEGTASFTYTAEDADGLQATGTVTIELIDVVWYIDNDPPAGVPIGTGNDGRSSSPFNNLTDYNAASGPEAGDIIFVHTGDSNYTGGITLLANQQLVGEGVALVVDGITLVTAGTRPTLTNSSGNAVTLASGNTLKGFNIGATTGAGITGSGVTGGTIENVAISGVGGAGVSLTNAGGTFTFATTTSISNATGTAFNVSGGNGTIDYNGTITNAAGRTIEVQSKTGGTVSFDGTVNATGGTGINLANNASTTIAFTGGLTLSTVANAAFTASSSGTLTVTGAGNTVTTTTGTAVSIQNTTIGGSGVSFQSVTTDGAATGVLLASTGSGAFTISGGAIQDASTRGVDIDTGSGNVTINATISTTAAGRSVEVSNRTGGTLAFGGAIDDTGLGINLSSNTNATMNFSGGLDIDTTTSTGFNATGGGTVNVTGAGNTIASTQATALNVADTNIGASGLTFQSISSGNNTAASDPANGIVLDTTGTQGGLTVSGIDTAGSGGTIQNSTGAGILLASTGAINLSYMNIQNGGSDGISGATVNGFSLTNVNVTSNGNAVGENGIELTQLTGSGGMASTVVSGSGENNVVIANTSGTLSAFNVTNSTFTNTNMTTGDDGFRFENNGSGSMTLSITGSTFTDNKGDHFQVATQASATGSINFTFSNNTLTTTPANDPNVVGGGITISPSGSADVIFTMNGNNVQQAFDEAINFNLGTASTAAASMIGTISNNIVGTPDEVDSGSESGSGITVTSNGAGLTTVAVTGNQVYQYANPYGIYIVTKEGSSDLNATVTGNTVANPGSFALNGIRIDAGATSANGGDSGTLCVALTGNSVAGSGPDTNTDIRLRQRFNTTIRLPGYGGANNDTTAVNAFVAGNNPGADVSSAHNVGGGGGGFVGGAACTLP